MSWICKECDSYNDDSAAVCFVCGCKRAAAVTKETKKPVERRAVARKSSDKGKTLLKELVHKDKYEKIYERLGVCYEMSIVMSIALAAIALMGSLIFGNAEEVGRAMSMTRDRVEENIDELMHSDYNLVIERIRIKLKM